MTYFFFMLAVLVFVSFMLDKKWFQVLLYSQKKKMRYMAYLIYGAFFLLFVYVVYLAVFVARHIGGGNYITGIALNLSLALLGVGNQLRHIYTLLTFSRMYNQVDAILDELVNSLAKITEQHVIYLAYVAMGFFLLCGLYFLIEYQLIK